MNLADLCVKRYEDNFGKGSWAELERDVRSRHKDFFEMYDALPEDDYSEWDSPKRWWQFWR